LVKNNIPKVGFIGAGTVGTALATLLASKGYQVVAVSSRSTGSAEKLSQAVSGCRVNENPQDTVEAADLIFITTPDDAIADVASSLKWRRGKSVVHCSGAASTDILETARRAGAMVGTIHPLQTLAGVKEAIENIPGSTFGIEGEEPLLGTLKEMARSLGGHPIELKAQDKVVYHAAAVMACNYLVTLIKTATDLWKTFNVPTDQATQALMPLIRGTVHNIDTIGIPNCLTGPIARGDTGTIKKHITSLEQASPDVLSLYRQLGLHTIPVSLDKGKINEAQAKALEDILKQLD